MSWPATEAELGPPVIAWLEEDGWDVYQEVDTYCGRADIAAVRGPATCIVEMKRSFSLDLLAQAEAQTRCANFVWVAVPKAKTEQHTAKHFASLIGVGVLTIHPPNKWMPAHADPSHTRPEFRRRVVDNWKHKLCPEQKTVSVAGSARGGHWTPFKRSCDELRRYAIENPGAPIKDALESFAHHWSSGASARAQVVKLIESGVIKTLRIERRGKSLHLYAVHDPAPPRLSDAGEGEG